MDEAFSFSVIGGYIGAGEVLDEPFPPIYDRQRYCKYQLLGEGNFLNFFLFLNIWRKEVLNKDPSRITVREEPILDRWLAS